MANARPAWANWCTDPALEPWTVGVEEEIMLLEPDGSPAWRSEDVLRELPDAHRGHTRGETHGLALELATDPHARPRRRAGDRPRGGGRRGDRPAAARVPRAGRDRALSRRERPGGAHAAVG